ncbi:MAG: hypothetical protein U0995_05210 [Erythrobacter sp.]|nr:hypothetical protein [Erythrobacter sp.]
MKSITSLRAIAMLGAGMVLAPQSALAQDAGAEDDDAYSGNVIVVTAQGRSQSLADVPVAISAISADML